MVYDPDVMRKFAEKLYNQAERYVIWGMLLGIVAGLALGYTLGGDIVWFFFMIVGGALGWAVGDAAGLRLCLQAQQALCQLQMEENTRAAAAADRRSDLPTET